MFKSRKNIEKLNDLIKLLANRYGTKRNTIISQLLKVIVAAEEESLTTPLRAYRKLAKELDNSLVERDKIEKSIVLSQNTLERIKSDINQELERKNEIEEQVRLKLEELKILRSEIKKKYSDVKSINKNIDIEKYNVKMNKVRTGSEMGFDIKKFNLYLAIITAIGVLIALFFVLKK